MRNNILIKPQNVKFKSYQEDAINSWLERDSKGIFDMATGTGKTFTALGAIEALGQKLNGNLAVFVVCPYKHLVGQWEEDIVEWRGNPIICHSESEDKNWQEHLIRSFKRFRQLGIPFICLTTNKSFAGDKIQFVIKEIHDDMNVLFVVDEAHNFGASQLSNFLPINIKFRLGLSATIQRYLDERGTQKLFDYFGERCIRYSLEEAIKDGKSLCPYEYYPIVTTLSKNELRIYEKLTKQVQECIIEEDGEVTLTEAGKMLLYKRARLLAGAESKIQTLKNLLKNHLDDRWMLIYCGATSRDDNEGETKQINEITKMLNNDLKITAHKFTAEESIQDRINIKKMFSDGLYQAITAIKCLDEGVNIPNIHIAFIMSSSRNPKEFIQRRGRLLRKSEGKEKAIIYDLIILPREISEIRFGDFESDKNIVLGELARAYEFGRVSLNPVETDALIEQLQNAYDVRFDLDELNKYSEEEYNEFDRS